MNHKHVSARIQHCRSNDPIVTTPCCGAWYHVTTKWLGSPGSTGVCWSKRRNQASWYRHRIKDEKLVGSNRQQHFRPFGCLASLFFYYISSYEHSWDFRFLYCVYMIQRVPYWGSGENLQNKTMATSEIMLVWFPLFLLSKKHVRPTWVTRCPLMFRYSTTIILKKTWFFSFLGDDLNFLATLNHPSSDLYNFKLRNISSDQPGLSDTKSLRNVCHGCHHPIGSFETYWIWRESSNQFQWCLQKYGINMSHI